MGLFDDYFDPQTFGSDGGGLYSRLLAVAQQQGRYQPGAGFDAPRAADSGQAPVLARTPVSLPAPRPAVLYRGPAFSSLQTPGDGQTPNIPIGNDQMPQFSGAQLSQAALPDLGYRLSAGLQSWAHTPVGNPVAALANGIAGLNSGQRTDETTVSPGSPQQRLEALKALLGEKDAMLATVDPQGAAPRVAQALMRQAATAKPPPTLARGLPGRATFPPSNVAAGPTGPGLAAVMRKRGLLK